MGIQIGNAPCSWGVETVGSPRNPPWERVLDECQAAGYAGIELGSVGYMPEDPQILGEALAARQLALIGGVLFRPFHDPSAWPALQDAARRTCQALQAHGAQQLVLIDSISARRAPTAGRPGEAEKMPPAEWAGFVERIKAIASMGRQEYGLTVSMHAHAGGFMDFQDELEALLAEVDESLLSLCVDTGHCLYAGFALYEFMKRYAGRIAYVHFKDLDPAVKAKVVAQRKDFYQACAEGLFCNLGQGEVDFLQVRDILLESGYEGWCTVEQDCDPQGNTSPVEDARVNRAYLRQIGF